MSATKTILAVLVAGGMVMAPAAFAQTSVPAADTEAQLQREKTIAENARREVEYLRGELALRDELIRLAVERNAEIYAIASEIADLGLSKRSAEPFIQANRVKLENLRQAYEDRLRAARFYDTTLPPSVQTRMEQDLNTPAKDTAGSQ